MPMLDKPFAELKTYQGSSPCPADIDAYWDTALAELAAIAPDVQVAPADFQLPGVECLELTFTGLGGARIFARYLRPQNLPTPHPAFIRFHGYYGESGDWFNLLPYVAMGGSVLAMDCRGQSGRSVDSTETQGKTMGGHITRGILEGPTNLYYRSVFLDAVRLAQIAMDCPEVDPARIAVFGASQGGALTLACAALEPRVSRIGVMHPFLSDYRRVWEMDMAKGPYEDLRKWFREYDPTHERENEFFHTLGYIDVQNLAHRIQCPVLFAATLMDDITPPSTQFAAFNKIDAEKHLLVYPDYAHEVMRGVLDKFCLFLATV